MGTIAARDAVRVLELSEQVAAAGLIATRQALHLRLRAGELTHETVGSPIVEFCEQMDSLIPFIDEDLPLDRVIAKLCTAIETRGFTLPETGAS
jgi:histidine ammonia-lyase